MANRMELVPGEWYHCYSRTIDKSRPFEDRNYISRFLETLYLANDVASMPNIPGLHKRYSHADIFALPRKQPLVAIGCYCIMPTHYHMLLQPLADGGITEFMRKTGIGFTRFYNEQNKRVGNLFVKPFRSRHVDDDFYLDRVIQYIHLNPVELFEPYWKKGIIADMSSLDKKLRAYAYSSLREHEGSKRPQSSIINLDALDLVRDNTVSTHKMLADAAEYYSFLEFDMSAPVHYATSME